MENYFAVHAIATSINIDLLLFIDINKYEWMAIWIRVGFKQVS